LLLQAFTGAVGLVGKRPSFAPPKSGELIARRLATSLGRGDGREARAINAALVLAAEHELAPPTFVARICASTGADVFACIGSALMAQSGPMQVGGSTDVETLFDRVAASPSSLDRFLPDAFGQSNAELPCFSHPLYDKDPRSDAVLSIVRSLKDGEAETGTMLAFVDAAARQGAYPNVFASLVILCRAMGLPRGSGAMLHTLARTAGWIAHVMEQRVAGTMLRPRARYMGPRVAA
jgi:citrate synthase